ncbi:MAG: sodium:calcium symporter [Verrucomicrobiota bacterium]|nr:sodium:calcium symporter [Verrucomicrobiota bacterium]
MIWRLEAMANSGFEGTALGTLIMPYCSGLGNLIFVFIVVRQHGLGAEIATNCIVNNTTNLTLLIGLPLLLWQQQLAPSENKKSGKKQRVAKVAAQITQLQLILTMTAALFFSGICWALARDGVIDFSDGLVLIGSFIFWQCFNVYDVLKTNLQKSKSISVWILMDTLLLLAAALGIYYSINEIVGLLTARSTGFFSVKNLGWLTGWLMVLPNALLALYYGFRRRPDVVYSSQIGDGHICIPLCLGLFALIHPIKVPAVFNSGLGLVAGGIVAHIISVGVFKCAPRWFGGVLIAAYAAFVIYGFN